MNKVDILALKSFVMDVLQSFNLNMDRVRTELYEQTKTSEATKYLWD